MEELGKLADACELVIQYGFSYSSAILLARNPRLRLLCVDIADHTTGLYYQYLQRMFPQRFELFPCDECLSVTRIPITLHRSFDGVVLGQDKGANALLSCLRFLKDDALLLLDIGAGECLGLGSILFEKENGSGALYKFHRPRIVICTLAIGDEYRQKMEMCINSKQLYASKWGYTLVESHDAVDHERPYSWSKIRQIQWVMQNYPKTEVIMWMDADTVVRNMQYTLDEILILLPRDKKILIGKDMYSLNAGVFFIKVGEMKDEVNRFLDKVYSQIDCIDDPWWEQAAMIRMFVGDEQYNSWVHVVPEPHMRLFNGYIPLPHIPLPFREQDFIVHFAGLSEENRKIGEETVRKSMTGYDTQPNIPVMWSYIVAALRDGAFHLPIYNEIRAAII